MSLNQRLVLPIDQHRTPVQQKILLLDDEQDFLDLYQEMLGQHLSMLPEVRTAFETQPNPAHQLLSRSRQATRWSFLR